MKYILLNNRIKDSEINDRIKYIYKVFHLYSYTKIEKNRVEIISIPNNSLNLTIIIGHNFKIVNYLLKNKVKTKILVLVTCFKGDITKIKFNSKTVYISKNTNGDTKYYDGNNWGFNFDITDSELDLFNSKENDVIKKLDNSFIRLENL